MARTRIISGVLAGALLAGLAGAVYAEQSTEEVIQKRRATMVASMRANGTLNAALKAGTPTPEAMTLLKGEAAKVVAAFDEMKNPALWPKGSGLPEVATGTKAKAEIWTDEAGFKAALDGAVAAAAQLKAGAEAENVDQMKAGVAAVQGACTTCHTKYRT